jgi:hypothetical protein
MGREFFIEPLMGGIAIEARRANTTSGTRVRPRFLPFVGSCPTCEGFFFALILDRATPRLPSLIRSDSKKLNARWERRWTIVRAWLCLDGLRREY